MKKIIFIAAAAIVAVVSCTKVNETYAPEEAVSFQVATQLAQTKAIDGVNNTKGDTLAYPYNNFGVYSYLSGTSTAWLMQNVEIVKPNWQSTTTYYWPKQDIIDFIGYYPVAETPWVSVAYNKLSCEKFTVTTEKEDLLYSDKAVGYGYSEKNVQNGVPMIFHHALAQVGVVVKAGYLTDKEKNTTWKITVNNIYFDDMVKEGGVEITLNDKNAWVLPADTIWTASETADKKDIIVPNLPVELDTTTAEKFADTVLLKKTVMPQMVKDQYMVVDYTIVTTVKDGDKTTTNTQEITGKKIKLYDNYTTVKTAFSNKVDRWGMNKWIFYTLTINPLNTDRPEDSKIKFDPKLIDWVYVNGGEYTL